MYVMWQDIDANGRRLYCLHCKGISFNYILQEFLDDGNGNVCGIKTQLVDWEKDDTGRWNMKMRPGKIPAFM